MIKTKREPIWSLDYRVSNSLLASSSPNCIRIFKEYETKPIQEFQDATFFHGQVSWLSDLELLSSLNNRSCSFFHRFDLEKQRKLKICQSRDFVNSFQNFRKGGFFTAGLENGEVQLFDLRQRDSVFEFRAHSSGVEVVRVGLQESVLVSGGRGGSLRFWDLRNLKCL